MKLTYKKGKQDKIHISVDGEYSFTVDETYFLSMVIYNGKEVKLQVYAHLHGLNELRPNYYRLQLHVLVAQ